jgi:hypothetical protein
VTSPQPPQRTTDEILADAQHHLARARTAAIGGEVHALVGIGNALVALVQQQHEFYREVVDVLDTARTGTPEA